MKITAEPRSDQWNADDFVGGPRTFTIAGVKVGTAEQKYDIELVEGEGRSWRPPLTILRLLMAAWGDDSTQWAGRRVTLYRDETIRFGADAVGGIRVSHMTNLPGNKPMTVKLTESRGKRKPYSVEPLKDAPPPTPTPAGPNLNDLFTEGGLDKTRKDERLTVAKVILKRPGITSVGDLNADDIKALVDQLAAWQTIGKLGEEIDNILDLAAIEAEGAK